MRKILESFQQRLADAIRSGSGIFDPEELVKWMDEVELWLESLEHRLKELEREQGR